MKKRKLCAALLTASIVVTTFVSSIVVAYAASGKVFDPAKLEAGKIFTSDEVVGDFTIIGSGKQINIGNEEEAKKATDGKEFTAYAKLQGVASQIKFTAAKGDKIVVYVMSGGSDDREIALYSASNVDEAGKMVPMNPQAAPGDATINVATFEAPADGEFFVGSVSKGLKIYYLTVGTVKDSVVPKTGVVSVAAVCGAVALVSAGVAVVTRKKED